jgi:hypothetical protein
MAEGSHEVYQSIRKGTSFVRSFLTIGEALLMYFWVEEFLQMNVTGRWGYIF